MLNKPNHMIMIACIGIILASGYAPAGFTERSLELAIMRLYDVMESLQSEHLNQSDERAIRFH